MKIIAVIPARYQSSRFPGKPLADICGKPMIFWVYQQIKKVEEIDDIYVATDDKRIYEAVESFNGQAIMTSEMHTCGTERIAECTNILKLNDEDIILNIQGDEPLIEPDMIRILINTLSVGHAVMGTLKHKITDENELTNSNVVKVVCDKSDFAIYFSRYCIPFVRDAGNHSIFYKHIGVYAYKKWFLNKFCSLEKTPLEIAESLEQLRAIENGYKIKVMETKYQTVGVDTPEQLKQVEEIIKRKQEQR